MENEKQESTPKKSVESKKAHKNPWVIGIVVILILGGIWYANQQAVSSNDVPANGIVATVNGEDITQAQVQAIQQQAAQSGSQLSQQQAFEQVLTRTLLMQEAEQRGLVATVDEAEAELSEALAEDNRTLEDLRQNLGIAYESAFKQYQQQLTLRALAMDESNVTVSEADVRIFYEENEESFMQDNETIPYEEVKDDIESYLNQQAWGEALNALTLELREEAVIEQ